MTDIEVLMMRQPGLQIERLKFATNQKVGETALIRLKRTNFSFLQLMNLKRCWNCTDFLNRFVHFCLDSSDVSKLTINDFSKTFKGNVLLLLLFRHIPFFLFYCLIDLF